MIFRIDERSPVFEGGGHFVRITVRHDRDRIKWTRVFARRDNLIASIAVKSDDVSPRALHAELLQMFPD